MSDKESGNVTTKKKRTNTRKYVAESILKINVKTMREYNRYTDSLKIIQSVVGEEKEEQFSKLVNDNWKNKKCKISMEQVKRLAEMPPEIIEKVVDLCLKHPQTAKQVIYNNIPNCTKRTTVTLPSMVSEWLDIEAEEVGMSKGNYITYILTTLYESKGE